MEHSCEHADNLLEEVLVRLLRAASPQASHAALDKISNPEKKERIKKQVFPDLLSHQELEVLSSTSLSLPMLESLEVEEFFSILSEVTNFNEEDICQCLVEGCEEELRGFLDKGLSPDYIFTQDVLTEDFVCLEGSSLLLCTLQACVQKNFSNVLYNVIALLLERGVDLEKECLGIDPLVYLCENENCFSEEVVLCLLTSVSSRKAFAVLAKVPDSDRRKHLEEVLRSSLSCFQFDPDLEREQEVLEQSMSVQVQEPLSNSLSVQIGTSTTQISSVNVINLEELIDSILSENLDSLEKILKDSFLLKKYNKEVQSKNPQETLFSFLIFNVSNVYLRHKLCLLFLKYKHTPETIVRENMTMAGLLCCLRRRVFVTEANILQGVLMETLFAVFFFFKEGASIDHVLKKLIYEQDKMILSNFFLDKETKLFSKKSINFTNLMKMDRNHNYNFCSLVKGFLDASLAVNQNMITEQTWNIEYLFSFFSCVKNRLSGLLKQNCSSQKKRKALLFDLLESLLKATVHENSFKEEKISMYKFLFQTAIFKNSGIQREVFILLRKYWGDFFDKSVVAQENSSKSQESVEKLDPSDLSSLEGILKNPALFEKCNKEVQAKNPQETLFSFLVFKEKNILIRHKLCLLFLKYGHTPRTIVRENTTMASLLCGLRRRIFATKTSILQGVLMKTLCSLFFFFKEGDSVSDILENIIYEQDKMILSNFFLDKETKLFSKKSIDFVNLMKMDRNFSCKSLLQGFLEISLITNKNVITEESWNVSFILPFLTTVKNRLCSFYKRKCREREQEKRKCSLLEILESLLEATVHENSFSEENKANYNFWFRNEFSAFKDTEVKIAVLELIQKYWGNVLDQENLMLLSEDIKLAQKNQDMNEQMRTSPKRKNQEEEDIVLTKRKKS